MRKTVIAVCAVCLLLAVACSKKRIEDPSKLPRLNARIELNRELGKALLIIDNDSPTVEIGDMVLWIKGEALDGELEIPLGQRILIPYSSTTKVLPYERFLVEKLKVLEHMPKFRRTAVEPSLMFRFDFCTQDDKHRRDKLGRLEGLMRISLCWGNEGKP